MSGNIISTHYSASGPAVVRSESWTYTGQLQPGAVTIIPQGRDGFWQSGAALDSNVFMPSSRLQSSSEELVRGRPVELTFRLAERDPVLFKIGELLSREAHKADAMSLLFTEQLLELLNAQLLRLHSNLCKQKLDVPKSGLPEWQVARIKEYMLANIERQIGLDELAAVAGLSRYHFCTCFRKATGKTPYHALTVLRMFVARDLLLSTKLPIALVATKVGYLTASSFSAAFRKMFGATPSECRSDR